MATATARHKAVCIELEIMSADDIETIKVDNEFRNLIPAISEDERKQLEENILAAGGVRDPLTLWLRSDEDWVLLDGHNRLRICKRHRLPFTYHQVEFETRDEAADWIDRNQLGRRNLSRQDYHLLLGRRYNRVKRNAGGQEGNANASKNDVAKVTTSNTTAKKLAGEHGVTEKTVRNAGKFQAAAAKLGIEKEIAAGEVKASQAEVVEAAARLPDQPTPDDIKRERDTVTASTNKQPKAKKADKKTAAGTRRANAKLANRVTLSLSKIRRDVETLSQTDSKYREQAVAELQRCLGHLSRSTTAKAKQPCEVTPDDELRAAVAKRWEAMRAWDKHWSIADMKDVRAMFMQIIRDEQKQFDR